jgi:hypothetical protein
MRDQKKWPAIQGRHAIAADFEMLQRHHDIEFVFVAQPKAGVYPGADFRRT